MPSPSAEPNLEPADVELLFDIADAAIVDGLHRRPVRAPALSTLPEALHEPVSAFVTLTVDGVLNGCIGGVGSDEPLGHAVARHAWSAAFADPRLPPLSADEYERLVIEISLLSALEPVAAASREELLGRLRPHVDGVVIVCGGRRALFLPAVWEQLPEPAQFLDHLILKAGLPPGSWPPGLQASRFTAARRSRKAGPGSSSSAA